MARARRYLPPFETTIEALGPGGAGIGAAPDGAKVQLKPAAPGAVLRVLPQGKKLGKWLARRLEMVTPPPGYTVPPCPAFGICGGCSLQELSLERQRFYKAQYALEEIASPLGWSREQLEAQVAVHPIRGVDQAYHYRNKVELSFGHHRFLSQPDLEAGESIDGRFLGFHAQGRFDRVADATHCSLISAGANALLTTLRREVLEGSQTPLWDPREHTGFWRYALLRQGVNTDELLVGLYTAPTQDPALAAEVERVAQALLNTPQPDALKLVGVIWIQNSLLSDVARGDVRQVWGVETLRERLGDLEYHLSLHAFFQTNTHAAELLYQTIDEALGTPETGVFPRLFDLYCGIGSIGLSLREKATQLVGVEEWEAAVVDARANAARNGVQNATYRAAKMEDALDVLAATTDGISDLKGAAVIVDPPRAGLHPRVSKALAELPDAALPATLLYVACHAASLGRDAAVLRSGGWQLVELWIVDLFPQTGHVEVVGRFARTPVTPAAVPGEA